MTELEQNHHTFDESKQRDNHIRASPSNASQNRPHHSLHHHNKQARIEDERIEWAMIDDFICPGLPARVEYSSLVSTITDSYKFISLKAKANWRKQFAKRASKRFAEVAFWWTFMDYVVLNHLRSKFSDQEPARIRHARSRLFDELATLYFHLHVGLHPKVKDSFMKHFDDGIAQCISLAYSTAYPGSKGHFDANFKLYVAQTLSQWIYGSAAPRKPEISHWGGDGNNDRRGRGSIIRLMFGNSNDAANEDDNALALIPTLSNGSPSADAGHLALVQFEQKLEDAGPSVQGLVNVETSSSHSTMEYAHSPLIDRILEMNGSGGDIADRKLIFRMTQSRRIYRLRPASELWDSERASRSLLAGANVASLQDGSAETKEGKEATDAEEDEELVAARKARETYRDVLRRTEENRHKLLAGYSSQRRKLAGELRQVKVHARSQQQELEASKKQAIKNDIHQLSNYLVSMWKVQDE